MERQVNISDDSGSGFASFEARRFCRRFLEKGQKMRRTITAILMVVALGLIGCSKTASTKQETKITTPGGTTTITTEKEVKQTGDNPPPATN
jgi:hypothetical protein